MKITQIDKLNLVQIVEPDDIQSVVFTLIPVNEIDLLVIDLGNEYFAPKPKDVAVIKANFEVGVRKYGLKEFHIELYDAAYKKYSAQNRSQYTKYELEVDTIADNGDIAKVLTDKINSLSKSTIENNMIVIQMGSAKEPMSDAEIETILEKIRNNIISDILDSLKGICIHNCLKLEGFVNK